MIKTPFILRTLSSIEFLDQRQKRARESRRKRVWAPPRESRIRQAEAGISVYNTLGPRQALFIMGWTRVLEASGGSGPPKARVLWAPIGIGGVNRRAVSLRSLFAHEPRVVFRDNKRATSSSAGTTTPRSFAPFLSFSFFFLFSFFLPLALLFVSLTIVSFVLMTIVLVSSESFRLFLHIVFVFWTNSNLNQ